MLRWALALDFGGSVRVVGHEILAHVQRRRRAVIQGLLWSLLALVLLTILLNAVLLWPDSFSFAAHWPNLAFCLVIGVALRLNQQNNFQAALGVIISLVLLAAAYPLVSSGVAGNEVSLFLFYIPVVLAGLLLGRKALWGVAGSTLLIVLLTPFLKSSGRLLSGLPPAEPAWAIPLQFALVMGIVLFFLDRFGTSLNDALIAMAEREVALEREIEERRSVQERLAMAFSVARMASYDTDWTTREVRGSGDLEALYGLPKTGRRRQLTEYLDVIHPDDRDVMLPSNDQGESNPTENQFRFRVVAEGGHIRWLTSVSKTILGEDGRPQRVVGIVIDTTETMEAQLALQRMNETLEERVVERTRRLEGANKELETFAYSVSHDLRAPLRGISGFTQILAEEHSSSLDEEARGYLKRIQGAADRMGELIDDLLKLSRLSGGEVLRRSVDLGALAREIAEELNQRSGGKAVEFEVAGDTSTHGDPKLLRIVLENLLGNSWKFIGDQVSPRVVFGAKAEDQRKIFYVQDNGVGFDMAYSSKLFKPFQRLQDSAHFEGSGIGLATVQRIVHRHAGEVWAEATPGAGATFFFTLEPNVRPVTKV